MEEQGKNSINYRLWQDEGCDTNLFVVSEVRRIPLLLAKIGRCPGIGKACLRFSTGCICAVGAITSTKDATQESRVPAIEEVTVTGTGQQLRRKERRVAMRPTHGKHTAVIISVMAPPDRGFPMDLHLLDHHLKEHTADLGSCLLTKGDPARSSRTGRR